jgi:hypothetical protein
MLTLNVSEERMSGGHQPWTVIPFFQAVYHSSVITYGSYASLVHPPYDELWPVEKAPADRLALLDRKFSGQFFLEGARSFAWGLQPMIPNYRPALSTERHEEIDFLLRIARVRVQVLEYLVHGTWLRPPDLDVPECEIDLAQMGIYTPLAVSRRRYPAVIAGAWRAPSGRVGLAIAGIDDRRHALCLSIDAGAYGLRGRCAVHRIDETGRHEVDPFDPRDPVVRADLPPFGICFLELRVDELKP